MVQEKKFSEKTIISRLLVTRRNSAFRITWKSTVESSITLKRFVSIDKVSSLQLRNSEIINVHTKQFQMAR